MAIIVEDGTGKSDADSYLSVADADTYVAAHGADATWTAADTATKEEGLRLGTQFIDLRYTERWHARRSTEDQALDWPRSGIIDRDGYPVDSNEIPTRLKDATTEAALRSVIGDILIGDLTNPGAIKRERVRVDVIEEDITYQGGKSQVKLYRIINMLLQQYVDPPGMIRRA